MLRVSLSIAHLTPNPTDMLFIRKPIICALHSTPEHFQSFHATQNVSRQLYENSPIRIRIMKMLNRNRLSQPQQQLPTDFSIVFVLFLCCPSEATGPQKLMPTRSWEKPRNNFLDDDVAMMMMMIMRKMMRLMIMRSMMRMWMLMRLELMLLKLQTKHGARWRTTVKEL